MPEQKAQHTPGPWFTNATDVASNYGGDIGIYAETPVHKNPLWVARVYDGGMLKGRSPEALANARLVAASPDLEAFARFVRDSYAPGATLDHVEVLRRANAVLAAVGGR